MAHFPPKINQITPTQHCVSRKRKSIIANAFDTFPQELP